MYSTDRGIEELAARRGEEEVSLEWLADRLRAFVDELPEFETPIDRLATWLARDDADADADADTDPDDVDPSGELGQPT
jgi:hypothetical protein